MCQSAFHILLTIQCRSILRVNTYRFLGSNGVSDILFLNSCKIHTWLRTILKFRVIFIVTTVLSACIKYNKSNYLLPCQILSVRSQDNLEIAVYPIIIPRWLHQHDVKEHLQFKQKLEQRGSETTRWCSRFKIYNSDAKGHSFIYFYFLKLYLDTG